MIVWYDRMVWSYGMIVWYDRMVWSYGMTHDRPGRIDTSWEN